MIERRAIQILRLITPADAGECGAANGDGQDEGMAGAAPRQFSMVKLLLVFAFVVGMSHAQQRSTSIKMGTFGPLTGSFKSLEMNGQVVLLAASGRIDQTASSFVAPSSDSSAKVMHTSSLAEETFLVPFGTSRLRLFLRHLPPSQHATENKRVVLFVHGASFPSGLAAAYPVGGHSWMEYLSKAGFDSWALDFMGYGGSDRYPQMNDSITSGAPLLRTEEASEQIEVAARFIRDKARVDRVSIIAHSWGTLPSGLLATRQPGLLDRLVLFGPVTLRHEQPDNDAATAAPAWNVTVDAQRKRFYGFVPVGEKPVLSASDMALWGPAYLASDPDSANRTPPSVRVPSGPLADSNLAWSGHFPYDPDKIRIPVLIIRGEWDVVTRNEDAHWLYSWLRNVPIKRDVVISRGTHVMHLESSRIQLYSEVQTFLEDKDPDFTQGPP